MSKILLPDYLITKITLYNSHPCASIIKKYWIEKLAMFLLEEGEGLYEIKFPINKSDIKDIDDIMFDKVIDAELPIDSFGDNYFFTAKFGMVLVDTH